MSDPRRIIKHKYQCYHSDETHIYQETYNIQYSKHTCKFLKKTVNLLVWALGKELGFKKMMLYDMIYKPYASNLLYYWTIKLNGRA